MSETINILLAEDERTLAMIIKDTLDGQGFLVTVASDGEEALRLYAADKPDVLVADVMMPRLDGYELVRRIRKTDQQTPVIFLTARSAVNDVVHGFEMGANDYLKSLSGCRNSLCASRRYWEGRALSPPSLIMPHVSTSVNTSSMRSSSG